MSGQGQRMCAGSEGLPAGRTMRNGTGAIPASPRMLRQNEATGIAGGLDLFHGVAQKTLLSALSRT